MIFRNCARFTDCISKINDTEVDDAKENDVIMYVLMEYTDNYSKTLRSLQQYDRNGQVYNNSGVIVDFTSDDASDSCSF